MSNETKSEDYERGLDAGYMKASSEDREYALSTKHKYIRDAALQVLLTFATFHDYDIGRAVAVAEALWAQTGGK